MPTGMDWSLGLYTGSSAQSLGGRIVSCTGPEKHASNHFDPHTGSRRADLHTTGIYWTIGFRLKLQTLSPFITAHCFKSNEAALSTFNLYVSDGITKQGWTNCLVDSCDLSLDQEGYLVADIVVSSLGSESRDLTVPADAVLPMTKESVTTFSVGGNSLASNWTSLKFGIKNNVTQLSAGNSVSMSEQYARHAEYSLDVQILKKAQLQYGTDSTTKTRNVVIGLRNNQASPATTTFTFANMDLSSNSVSVDNLNAVYERIAGAANSVVIS